MTSSHFTIASPVCQNTEWHGYHLRDPVISTFPSLVLDAWGNLQVLSWLMPSKNPQFKATNLPPKKISILSRLGSIWVHCFAASHSKGPEYNSTRAMQKSWKFGECHGWDMLKSQGRSLRGILSYQDFVAQRRGSRWFKPRLPTTKKTCSGAKHSSLHKLSMKVHSSGLAWKVTNRWRNSASQHPPFPIPTDFKSLGMGTGSQEAFFGSLRKRKWERLQVIGQIYQKISAPKKSDIDPGIGNP